MTLSLALAGWRAAWVGLCFGAGLTVGSTAWAGPIEQSRMQLSSGAFSEGGAIPAKNTCDEKDLSPPLKWSGVPAGARSLALIVDDPDAPGGTWAHWVHYNMKPADGDLPEGTAKSKILPDGTRQGMNDFGGIGYGGPCPPHGKAHRYFFKLYALDKALDLGPGATKKDVEKAMQGHIVAQGQLMGTYQRK